MACRHIMYKCHSRSTHVKEYHGRLNTNAVVEAAETSDVGQSLVSDVQCELELAD